MAGLAEAMHIASIKAKLPEWCRNRDAVINILSGTNRTRIRIQFQCKCHIKKDMIYSCSKFDKPDAWPSGVCALVEHHHGACWPDGAVAEPLTADETKDTLTAVRNTLKRKSGELGAVKVSSESSRDHSLYDK